MKIRKVSAELLDRRPPKDRPMSARERKRLALESELEGAIKRANEMPNAAFLVELDSSDKAPTVRNAFNRVRARLELIDVNLFVRDGSLLIAKRPQNKGRRKSA